MTLLGDNDMKLVLDTHCHSVASGHANSTITQCIDYAKKIGLELLAITDHGPKMPDTTNEIYFSNFNFTYDNSSPFKVLFGSEVNIIDYNGEVDLDDEILKKLDVVIASFHSICISPSNIDDCTNAIFMCMENPNINIIGHPGEKAFPLHYEEIVKKSKETGTLLEVNNLSFDPHGIRYDSVENIKEMIKICKDYECPIIIGSDAHTHKNIAKFDRAVSVLKKFNFPEKLIVNTSVDYFKSFIQ